MNKKKVVALSGITGFVGSFVKTYLEKKGLEVIPLSRTEFSWSDNELAYYLEKADFIIHLAGESIVKKWSKKNREKIVLSRVETTKKIARCIALMKKKPEKVINASAIGIYNYSGKHTEDSTAYGDTFLSRTVQKWEKAAHEIEETGTPLCICRIGVVMGENGGMLPQLVKTQKLGFGIRIGSGKQVISFIHIHDLARGFLFLLKNENASGIFNMVAPENISQVKLLKVLHRIYKKSIILVCPAFLFKLLMGERANLLVEGEYVIPKRLEKEGYDFLYPNIENVLFYLSHW